MSEEKNMLLNEGHYVEAIDRAYIVVNFIETTLMEHPVFQKHPELKIKTDKAQQLILEIYQEIGAISEKEFPSQPEHTDTVDNSEA